MVAALLRYLPSALRCRLESTLQHPGFANTLWLLSDRLVRMGVGLLVGVWVARYLGPEGYGLLSFAGSYVMLFSAIALFGLESLVVRELLTSPDQRPQIMGTTLLMRLGTGLLALVAAVLLIPLVRPADPIALALVAVLGSALLFQSLEVIDLWFQHRVASRYAVIARSSAFLFSSGAKIAVVLTGGGVVAIGVATALEALLTAMALLLAYRLSGERASQWRWDRGWYRRLLHEAVPMVLSGVVLMIYLRIDQVMLGMLTDQTEVGFYAAAVRIAEVWYFVPTVIVSSVFPELVKLHSSDQVLFQQKLQRLYSLLAFLGYAVALPVTLLAPWLVQLLFGAAYRSSAPLLAVLIWAGLFANISVARNSYLIAINSPQALFWFSICGAVSNIVLNLALIPLLGGMGAVLATLFSYWFAAHGACYLVPAFRPVGAVITRSLLWPRFW
jgi:O-antigen/teichoic acid export membrane protein